jgi:magnesium transporter
MSDTDDQRPDEATQTAHDLFDELKLDPSRSGEIGEALEQMHPAEVADEVEQLSPEQRADLIERLPGMITPDVLAEFEPEVVEDILPLLPTAQIAEALGEMDGDDATQIAEELGEAQLESVLDAMDPTDRANLEAAFAFEEDEVGRLMQREYVAAPMDWTVGNTIDHMRAQREELPDMFYNIYVVDRELTPLGYVPVSKLMRAARKTKLSEIMADSLHVIEERMDQEEAAYIFEKYHLISAPVVDAAGHLIGMMTVDDILDIIQDENTEDLLALAGVSDATLTDTAIQTVKARAPWLLVNLVTAIIASLVIAQFDEALAQIVALAILMPIVASMGGNAGTQALTVTVRQLSERELTSKTAWRAIRREVVAAGIIGIIFALLMGGIAWVWFGDNGLALVIFFAMIVNHLAAGLAGIAVPLTMKRLGGDPAVASSVFVTTVTDVVGFLAFLGLAVLLLM